MTHRNSSDNTQTDDFHNCSAGSDVVHVFCRRWRYTCVLLWCRCSCVLQMVMLFMCSAVLAYTLPFSPLYKCWFVFWRNNLLSLYYMDVFIFYFFCLCEKKTYPHSSSLSYVNAASSSLWSILIVFLFFFTRKGKQK